MSTIHRRVVIRGSRMAGTPRTGPSGSTITQTYARRNSSRGRRVGLDGEPGVAGGALVLRLQRRMVVASAFVSRHLGPFRLGRPPASISVVDEPGAERRIVAQLPVVSGLAEVG